MKGMHAVCFRFVVTLAKLQNHLKAGIGTRNEGHYMRGNNNRDFAFMPVYLLGPKPVFR